MSLRSRLTRSLTNANCVHMSSSFAMTVGSLLLAMGLLASTILRGNEYDCQVAQDQDGRAVCSGTCPDSSCPDALFVYEDPPESGKWYADCDCTGSDEPYPCCHMRVPVDPDSL